MVGAWKGRGGISGGKEEFVDEWAELEQEREGFGKEGAGLGKEKAGLVKGGIQKGRGGVWKGRGGVSGGMEEAGE